MSKIVNTSIDKTDYNDKVTIEARYRCRQDSDHHAGDGQCSQKGIARYGYQMCDKHGRDWRSSGATRLFQSAQHAYERAQNYPNETEYARDENGQVQRDDDGNIIRQRKYPEEDSWVKCWAKDNAGLIRLLGMFQNFEHKPEYRVMNDGEAKDATLSEWWEYRWAQYFTNYLGNNEHRPWEDLFDNARSCMDEDDFHRHSYQAYYNTPFYLMNNKEFLLATALDYDREDLTPENYTLDKYTLDHISDYYETFRLSRENEYRGNTDHGTPLNQKQLAEFEEWKAVRLEMGRTELLRSYSWKGTRMEQFAVQVAENMRVMNEKFMELNEAIRTIHIGTHEEMTEVFSADYCADESALNGKEWAHWVGEDWFSTIGDAVPEAPKRKPRKKTTATLLKELDISDMSEEEMAAALRALKSGEVPA